MSFFLVLMIGATVAPISYGNPAQPLPPQPIASKSGVRMFAHVKRPACSTRDNVTNERNAIIGENYRWSQFNVYPDNAYDDNERQAINDAMYELSQIIPCVGFGLWPRNSDPWGDYVYVKKGTDNGCDSYVGKLGGRQNMNLQAPACLGHGTILHEMLHALGMHHEHQRRDRDDFINVHWENVLPGWEWTLEKYPENQYDPMGVQYNHRSIMHYYSYDISKNGRPTMTTKAGETFGSNEYLQQTDIRKLKLMYNC